MKKLSFLFSILVVFAITLAACGTDSNETEGATGETITIEHELGEAVVKLNPEKVIAFDFGMIDTLDQLGIEVIALPKATIPDYLSKYEDDKYENVGSLKEPDFEKIHSLQPDLIIISGRQAELYEQFDEIAPTVYLPLDTTRYMESFKENTGVIGKIFGKEDEVKKEHEAIDEKINELNKKVTALEGKALVILANEGKMSAYGPKSRYGIIHDVFGFEPVDENIEVSTHGQNISSEYILEQNPDYLFVIDRSAAIGTEGSSAAKDVVENALVQKTKAYENDNIIYLHPENWYLAGGGLKSVLNMVEEVEAALQD